jgi:hypothetical protein
MRAAWEDLMTNRRRALPRRACLAPALLMLIAGGCAAPGGAPTTAPPSAPAATSPAATTAGASPTAASASPTTASISPSPAARSLDPSVPLAQLLPSTVGDRTLKPVPVALLSSMKTFWQQVAGAAGGSATGVEGAGSFTGDEPFLIVSAIRVEGATEEELEDGLARIRMGMPYLAGQTEPTQETVGGKDILTYESTFPPGHLAWYAVGDTLFFAEAKESADAEAAIEALP